MPDNKDSEPQAKIDREGSVWEVQKVKLRRLLNIARLRLKTYISVYPSERLSSALSEIEDALSLLENMEEGAIEVELPCLPFYYGIVQDGEVDGDPAYLVRCSMCDEPLPFSFFDSEGEWQEFRTAVGAHPRRYNPDTDEFVEPPAEEPERCPCCGRPYNPKYGTRCIDCDGVPPGEPISNERLNKQLQDESIRIRSEKLLPEKEGE